MKVVVTGISGYIGGQVALQLRDAGYEVYGIDRRQPPEHLRGVAYRFLYQDFGSDVAMAWLAHVAPDAIIHCAGTSLVGPSITNPEDYYNNNFVKTKRLLDLVVNKMPNTRVIFSSSAATYGNPVMVPCQEEDPPLPISPYGESKLMIEMMMNAYRQAYNLDFVAFRYFNACGADHLGRHGQEPGATHIIARVLESIRDNKEFTLYGIKYPTADGTCIRDYVHVEDIANAHLLALDPEVPTGIYNLGTNTGTSNLEIITLAQEIANKSLIIATGPNRVGDPAELTASDDKFKSVIKDKQWRKYTLHDVIQHAWNWYNK